MHKVLKHLRSSSGLSMLLVIVGLTACGPALMPTQEAALASTPVLSPSAVPFTATVPPLTSTPVPLITIETIQMMDRSSGWAIGWIGADGVKHLLHTTDGGATWRNVLPTLHAYFVFFFLDERTAWVRSIENEELWRTQDGGLSWTSLGPVEGSEFWFNDPQHGWKMDAEAWGLSYVQFDILSFSTTQDGGATWQEAELPPRSGLAYMAYPDPKTAWAVRAGFAKTVEGSPNLAVPFSLLRTNDGGRSWDSLDLPRPPGVELVGMAPAGSFVDAGNCEFDSPVYASLELWTFALTCEQQGWFYSSTNQGRTWAITPLPAGYVTDIQAIDPSTGWLVRKERLDAREAQLYETTDGGQTWTLLASPPWADASLNFVDDQFGWAVVGTCGKTGCSPHSSPDALERTTDGGKTWQTLQPQLMP